MKPINPKTLSTIITRAETPVSAGAQPLDEPSIEKYIDDVLQEKIVSIAYDGKIYKIPLAEAKAVMDLQKYSPVIRINGVSNDSKCQYVVEVKIEKKKLRSIPPEIRKFSQLRRLSLAENRLKDVRISDFDCFNHLQNLDISVNRINFKKSENKQTLSYLKENKVNVYDWLQRGFWRKNCADLVGLSLCLGTLGLIASFGGNIYFDQQKEKQMDYSIRIPIGNKYYPINKLDSEHFKELTQHYVPHVILDNDNRIVCMELNKQEFDEIPSLVFDFNRLRTLDLSGNKLKTLLVSRDYGMIQRFDAPLDLFGKLEALEKLILTNNSLDYNLPENKAVIEKLESRKVEVVK
jgi:hypothetical protein